MQALRTSGANSSSQTSEIAAFHPANAEISVDVACPMCVRRASEEANGDWSTATGEGGWPDSAVWCNATGTNRIKQRSSSCGGLIARAVGWDWSFPPRRLPFVARAYGFRCSMWAMWDA